MSKIDKIDNLIFLIALSLFILGIYDHKLPAILYSLFPLLPAAAFYRKDFPPRSSKFLCLLTHTSVALVNTVLLLQDAEGFMIEYLTKPFAWTIILSAALPRMELHHYYNLKSYRGVIDLLAAYIVTYFFPFSHFGYTEGWIAEPLFVPVFLISHLLLAPPIYLILIMRAHGDQ